MHAIYIYIHVGVSVCVVRRVDDEGAAEWQERRWISICTFELLFIFLAGKSRAMVIPPSPVRYNLGTRHAIACKRIRDKITN